MPLQAMATNYAIQSLLIGLLTTAARRSGDPEAFLSELIDDAVSSMDQTTVAGPEVDLLRSMAAEIAGSFVHIARSNAG